MTYSDARAVPGQSATLHATWKAASIAAGWLRPGDWGGDATLAMAQSVSLGEGEVAAAGVLGADRSDRGVGLAEGFADLAALYSAAAGTEPPFAVARAFAQSWSEASTAAILGRGAIDAMTGLGTPDYLFLRVREVYAEGRARGIPTRDEWCAILLAASGAGDWEGMLGRLARAKAVSDVLDRGESTVALPSGAIVSLARVGTAREQAARLRIRLRSLGGAEPEITVLALPDDPEDATRLLLPL